MLLGANAINSFSEEPVKKSEASHSISSVVKEDAALPQRTLFLSPIFLFRALKMLICFNQSTFGGPLTSSVAAASRLQREKPTETRNKRCGNS